VVWDSKFNLCSANQLKKLVFSIIAFYVCASCLISLCLMFSKFSVAGIKVGDVVLFIDGVLLTINSRVSTRLYLFFFSLHISISLFHNYIFICLTGPNAANRFYFEECAAW
jgi:hypothetical protein